MLSLVLLVPLVVSVFGSAIPGRSVPILDGRIVGGEDTTIEKIPWQISLRFFGGHLCGGSIIGLRRVLTAAHCVVNRNINDLEINAGHTNRNGVAQLISVSSVHIHPDYVTDGLNNDIAVLILHTSLVVAPGVQVIDLPRQDQTVVVGSSALVTGWGALWEGGPAPDILQKVTIPVVDQNQCNMAYGGIITPQMFCAGVPEGGQDACQGDSGGPVVIDGELAGVVSFGMGCARPGFPGVYVRVSMFRQWIDSI